MAWHPVYSRCSTEISRMKDLLHNTYLVGVLSKLNDLMHAHVDQRLAHRDLSLSVRCLCIFFQLFRSPGGTGRVGIFAWTANLKGRLEDKVPSRSSPSRVLALKSPPPTCVCVCGGGSTLQRPLEGALEMWGSVHAGRVRRCGRGHPRVPGKRARAPEPMSRSPRSPGTPFGAAPVQGEDRPARLVCGARLEAGDERRGAVGARRPPPAALAGAQGQIRRRQLSPGQKLRDFFPSHSGGLRGPGRPLQTYAPDPACGQPRPRTPSPSRPGVALLPGLGGPL